MQQNVQAFSLCWIQEQIFSDFWIQSPEIPRSLSVSVGKENSYQASEGGNLERLPKFNALNWIIDCI